jgi:hypothetical protein
MSFMAHKGHIAITIGDTSTTSTGVSVSGCPVAPRIDVTQGDSSDTYRRIGPDSEIVHSESCHQFAHAVARGVRQRATTRWCIASATSHSDLARASMAADVSATDSSVLSAAAPINRTRPP